MSFLKYILFPKRKAIVRQLQVRWKTMHYYYVLRSNWQGNDIVTFLEQLFSIKADFQDARRLLNAGKVNSLQIIVPFIPCVFCGVILKCVCFHCLYRNWKTSLKAQRHGKDIGGQRSRMWSNSQEFTSYFILANVANF